MNAKMVACECLQTHHQETLDRVAGRLSSRLPDGADRLTFLNYYVTYPSPDPAMQDAYHARKAVQDLITARTGLLTLCGGVGRGKTHLAIAAYHWLHAAGYAPVYVNYADLLERRRATFDLSGDDALAATAQWQAIRLCRYLILDDLGAEMDTDWAAATRYQIVAQRYEMRASALTIITTNVHPDKLGPRVASRLRSREEGVRLVVLRGTDRRLTPAGGPP